MSDDVGNVGVYGEINGESFYAAIPYWRMTGSYVNSHSLYKPGKKVMQSNLVSETGDKFYSESGNLIWNTNMSGDPNRVFVITDDKMKIYRSNLAMSKNWTNGANQLRLDTRAMSTEYRFMTPNINKDYLHVYPEFSNMDFLGASHFGIEGFAAGYVGSKYGKDNDGLEDFYSRLPGSTTGYWKSYYSVMTFEPWW